MGFPICDSIKSVLKLQFPQIRGTVIVIVFAGINRIGSGKYHVMNSIRPQAILLACHVLRKHQLSFFGIISEKLSLIVFTADTIKQPIFRMKSQRGRIVLIGVSMYFFIHFLFNVGGVTGLIPLTGVPLLMISAGGSSTLSVMVAVGMGQAVISQYRQGKIE